MKKLFISLSAIPLSLYRKSVAGLTMNNPNLYTEIFSKYGSGTTAKNKNRIYIPLDSKAVLDTKKPNAKVVEFLTKNKFKLDNYKLGTAIMPDGKRTIKIGKLLAKEPKLKKLFDNDPSRSGSTLTNENMLVVISRHPYDILGLSFDRGWSSCTNLKGGSNVNRLKDSLKHGLLVAYLIKTSDKNINKPSSRILIRPYFNSKGDVVLSADENEYGTADSRFRKTVLKFLSWANSGSPKGEYDAPLKMYLDSAPSEIWHGLTAKDIKTPGQIQYLTEEKDLLELTNKKSFREEVMHNIHATEKVLMLGVQDNDAEIRHAAVGNPNASREILMLGIRDEREDVRRSAMENSNADTEILMLGIRDKREDVRRAVMENPNADTEILMLGAKDASLIVKVAVMGSPKAGPDILMLGAKDKDYFVRRASMNNIYATPKLLMLGAKDEEYSVRLAVAENPNADTAILRLGAKDEREYVRRAVMENPNADTAILILGAKDASLIVRVAVMGNKNADNDILMLGAKDKESDVRRSVMGNKNASLEILMLGAKDKDSDVRLAVMENKNASLEILMLGAKDEDSDVRVAVMGNKNASLEILMLGEKDEEYHARRAASENKRRIESLMQ